MAQCARARFPLEALYREIYNHHRVPSSSLSRRYDRAVEYLGCSNLHPPQSLVDVLSGELLIDIKASVTSTHGSSIRSAALARMLISTAVSNG